MVVPVDSGVDVDKGFGRKNLSYESEGYVAAPADVSVIFANGGGGYHPLVIAGYRDIEFCVISLTSACAVLDVL